MFSAHLQTGNVGKLASTTYQHRVVVHAIHLQPLHLVQIVHLGLGRCQAPANTGQIPHMGCFLLVGLVDELERKWVVMGFRVRKK
jgi:hypothetical protein